MLVTRISVWLYVLAMVVTWLVIRFEADRWWLATVVIFGPTWLTLPPLAVLALLAVQ